ncbi:hypothetical protein F5888DRAFT_1841592 [Russula emetica]|nr:hypothetical protein F5888DRAFT_1841592 [Russula emetica]
MLIGDVIARLGAIMYGGSEGSVRSARLGRGEDIGQGYSALARSRQRLGTGQLETSASLQPKMRSPFGVAEVMFMIPYSLNAASGVTFLGGWDITNKSRRFYESPPGRVRWAGNNQAIQSATTPTDDNQATLASDNQSTLQYSRHSSGFLPRVFRRMHNTSNHNDLAQDVSHGSNEWSCTSNTGDTRCHDFKQHVLVPFAFGGNGTVLTSSSPARILLHF